MIQSSHFRSRNRTDSRRFWQKLMSERFVLLMFTCVCVVSKLPVVFSSSRWLIIIGRIWWNLLDDSIESVKTTRNGSLFPFVAILSRWVVVIITCKSFMSFLTLTGKALVRFITSHLPWVNLWTPGDAVVVYFVAAVTPSFKDLPLRGMLTLTVPKPPECTWRCNSAFRTLWDLLTPPQDNLNQRITLLSFLPRSV